MFIRTGWGLWEKGVQLISRNLSSNRKASKKSKYAYDICSHCGSRHSEFKMCAQKLAKLNEKKEENNG